MSAAYDTYRTLMSSGRFEDAARLAESEYLKDDAGNPFWLTRQAAALSRAGRHEPALGIAQNALALQPANPYALLAVAEALQGLKKLEDVLLHYEDIADHPRLSAAARRGDQWLAQMPAVIAGFLNAELPRLLKIAATQKRRFIITTDHGLSLTRSGLSHGAGGVYEQAVFRYVPD
jgi:tetratricopeptide (TPR) repeat protein